MEPKLSFAIICEHAFIDQGNRLTIIQTFDEIKAKNFPAIHPKLAVVTNYISDERDPEKNIDHLVIISDPDGEKIADLPIKRTGIEKKTQFISYFNDLPLKKPGTYNIEIKHNGNTVETLPLEVTKI